MPNNKEIRIKAVLDQDGFDNQVNALQQKLQNMQRNSQQFAKAQESFAGGKMGNYTRAFTGDFDKESINNLRETFNLNSRKLAHESRDLNNKQRELKKLETIEGNITKTQQSRIGFLKEEINLVKQRGRETISQQSQIQQQAQKMGADLGAGGWKGVPLSSQGAAARGGMLSNILDALGGWKGAAGVSGAGISAGTTIGTGIAQHRVARDRTLVGEVANMQKTANQDLMYQIRGQGSRSEFERKERQAALTMAQREMSGQRGIDLARLVGGGAGSVLGGMGIGAGIGGMIGGGLGMMAGGVGAIPGAALGAKIGAGAGGLMGAGRTMMNRRNYNQMFDQGAYEGQLTGEMVQNYQKNLQGFKANPRFIARDMWQQNYKGFQNVQRATGETTQGLLGGQVEEYAETTRPERAFEWARQGRGVSKKYTESRGEYQGKIEEWKQSSIDARLEVDERNRNRNLGWFTKNMMENGTPSFSRKRIEQNMGEMLGAGAMTEYVQGQGTQTAAQLQRMGMTGASKGLGKLSGLGSFGGFGETQGTDDTFIRLMAEGMSVGIDQSNMREEARRYQNMTIQLMYKTGGAEGAVQEFTGGMVGLGAREMQGAMSAFERRNVMAGKDTGAKGALKWAYLQSEKGAAAFAGVDEDTKSWAVSADLKSLDQDHPMVQYIAQQMGVDEGEAIKRIRSLQKSGMHFQKETDDARENVAIEYKKFLTRNNLKGGTESIQSFRKSKEGIKAIGAYGAKVSKEEAGEFARQSGPEFLSVLTGMAGLGGVKGVVPKQEDIYGPMTEEQLRLSKEFKPEQGGISQSMADIRKRMTAGPLTAADKEEAATAKSEMANLSILNDNLKDFTSSAETHTKATDAQTKATVLLTRVMNELVEYVTTGDKTVDPNITRIIEQLNRQAAGNQPTGGK